VTGVTLTKMDGDARGGAALSIYGVTKKPIKYIGVGEKVDALEEFHPDRMAGRILQMGDVLTLVEKAQGAFDMEQAKKLEKKVRKEGMDLDDFLVAMRQMQKLGPMENLLKLLPGVNAKAISQAKIDPKRMKHVEAIVLSMTPAERKKPDIINGSRRSRIAKGAGRTVTEVNQLLDQFRGMQKMMKKMAGGGPGGMPGMPGGGMPREQRGFSRTRVRLGFAEIARSPRRRTHTQVAQHRSTSWPFVFASAASVARRHPSTAWSSPSRSRRAMASSSRSSASTRRASRRTRSRSTPSARTTGSTTARRRPTRRARSSGRPAC
jgi:hypothetical protein